MKKKAYINPEQHIIVLQHQSHLLQASGGKVRSLGSSGPFYYGGSDDGYEGPARARSYSGIDWDDEE